MIEKYKNVKLPLRGVIRLHTEVLGTQKISLSIPANAELTITAFHSHIKRSQSVGIKIIGWVGVSFKIEKGPFENQKMSDIFINND